MARPRKADVPPIGYSLKTIEVIDYACTYPPFAATPSGEVDAQAKFGVNTQFFFAHDMTHVLVKTMVDLHLREAEDQPEHNVCKLVTQMRYDVTNMERYLEGNLLAPTEEFLGNVANASVSTTRGIFMAKNFGTPYSTLFMPLISTQKLIPVLPIELSISVQNTTFETKEG
jgi:hypothetical protein